MPKIINGIEYTHMVANPHSSLGEECLFYCRIIPIVSMYNIDKLLILYYIEKENTERPLYIEKRELLPLPKKVVRKYFIAYICSDSKRFSVPTETIFNSLGEASRYIQNGNLYNYCIYPIEIEVEDV